MSRRSEELECKVFVGGLPNDATPKELENAFEVYGSIRKVWLARRPPGFAFIEFNEAQDAEDAVRGLNGSRICGVRARVELSRGRGRGRSNGGGGGYSNRGRGFTDGRDNSRRFRSRSPRHFSEEDKSSSYRRSPRYDFDDRYRQN